MQLSIVELFFVPDNIIISKPFYVFVALSSRLKMPLFCTSRDVVLASLERYDSDQRCYILALRSTEHPLIQQSHNTSSTVRYRHQCYFMSINSPLLCSGKGLTKMAGDFQSYRCVSVEEKLMSTEVIKQHEVLTAPKFRKIMHTCSRLKTGQSILRCDWFR